MYTLLYTSRLLSVINNVNIFILPVKLSLTSEQKLSKLIYEMNKLYFPFRCTRKTEVIAMQK